MTLTNRNFKVYFEGMNEEMYGEKAKVIDQYNLNHLYPTPKIEIIKPDRKQINCLVDQLIKLNDAYRGNGYQNTYSSSELTNAMKIINKSLENTLNPMLVLKEKDKE